MVNEGERVSEFDEGWDACLEQLGVDREELFTARREIARLRALAESENARGGVARDEIARLRAELAKAQQHDSWRATAHWKRRADAAEAAIARVRELCADHEAGDMSDEGYVCLACTPYLRDAVLRALDGAE